MTESLPENVRQAGVDALEELATRMSRGAANLYKQAMRLRLDDPKSQPEPLCQLRRFQNFKMPGFEQVAVIEGALMGLTEAESRALKERQRTEKYRKDAAARERWEEAEKSRPATYWELKQEANRLQAALDALSERASALDIPNAKPRQDGNVIAGPWDAGGEVRP